MYHVQWTMMSMICNVLQYTKRATNSHVLFPYTYNAMYINVNRIFLIDGYTTSGTLLLCQRSSWIFGKDITYRPVASIGYLIIFYSLLQQFCAFCWKYKINTKADEHLFFPIDLPVLRLFSVHLVSNRIFL